MIKDVRLAFDVTAECKETFLRASRMKSIRVRHLPHTRSVNIGSDILGARMVS